MDKSISSHIVKVIGIITIFMVVVQLFLFLFINVFTNTSNAAFSTISNDDGTTTATWDFDDPMDYIMQNTTISDNHAILKLETYNWSQSTQQDFDNGTKDNVTTSAGEVKLSTTEEELIANGNFTTDSNWTFIDSANGNITSQWSSDENAWMYHSILKTVEINVYDAEGNGYTTDPLGLPGVIQFDDGDYLTGYGYYKLQQDDDIYTINFNVTGMNGTIVKVVLWGQYRVYIPGGGTYNGDDNLRYRNSSFGGISGFQYKAITWRR